MFRHASCDSREDQQYSAIASMLYFSSPSPCLLYSTLSICLAEKAKHGERDFLFLAVGFLSRSLGTLLVRSLVLIIQRQPTSYNLTTSPYDRASKQRLDPVPLLGTLCELRGAMREEVTAPAKSTQQGK